jgi:hypothetical protein
MRLYPPTEGLLDHELFPRDPSSERIESPLSAQMDPNPANWVTNPISVGASPRCVEEDSEQSRRRPTGASHERLALWLPEF